MNINLKGINTTFRSLTQYPQWILCRFIPGKNGKVDKIPCDKAGNNINAHDSNNWLTYDDAAGFVSVHKIGLGFVFTKDDPFFFIDIDNCAVGAKWNDIAMELCGALPGAAVEVSQSRTGLHIIGQCGVLPDRSIKCGSDFDLYTESRFVAITGLNAVGDDSLDHTAALTEICHKYLPPRGTSDTDTQWTTEPVPEWEDPGNITGRALASKSAGAVFGGGVSFRDLWTANAEALGKRWPDDHGPQGREYDASSADMALAQHLAFWTGKNCEMIRILMCESELYRPERWDHGGYLQRTILRAVSMQKEVFTGGKKFEVVGTSGGGGDDSDSDTDAPPYTPTDDGNRDYLVYMYGNQLRYSHQRKSWLVWGGDRWMWDVQNQIVEFGIRTVRELFQQAFDAPEEQQKQRVKFALQSRKKGSIDNMISLAQSAPGIPVLVDQLDAQPELVNCKNGTLNLDTGELKPHNKDDLITKILSCDYVPEAQSDVWDGFLHDVTQGDQELIWYLQRVFGYALLGAVKEKHLWFIYGPSNSGKSTFINAVFEVFGDYGHAASFETWLKHSVVGGNRGDIVDLMGARLVTSVEVRRGAKFDEALLKSVTGGDRVKAAAKYERDVEFVPMFTLILAGNDAPIVRDDDDGMWTRMRRVPFAHTIDESKQDKRLGEKLKSVDVQQAILAWLVNGYQAWTIHGVGSCTSVDRSNSEYRMEMDRVKGFFEDELEFSNNGRIPVANLRSAYEIWAKDNGVRMLPVREFNKRLRMMGCEQGRTNIARVWSGVSLASENYTNDKKVT